MHNETEEILKETKTKYAIYLYPSQMEEIKSLMDQANAKSQSEFVSDAIRFYIGYLQQGKNVILEIDPQGAIAGMENPDVGHYVSVFILPPSYKVLRERLTARKTEPPEVIDRRMNNARAEIAKLDRYQYAIINDEIGPAFDDLLNIIKAEKMRTVRYMPEIPEE